MFIFLYRYGNSTLGAWRIRLKIATLALLTFAAFKTTSDVLISVGGSGFAWIRIDLAVLRIRIRIRTADPDPNPGAWKLTKVYK